MIAEELKIVIRAEAQRAAKEIAEVSKNTDNAENSTKKLISTMAKSAAGFAAAAISVRALIGSVKESVRLAGIQEQAERGLEAALMGVGDASGEGAEMLKQYAAELQGVTTFGDEATISAAALFTQLSGMSAEMTRKALPAIQDFASAMGMDLNSAAQIVGKSIGSSTNALTRYGVEIDNSLTGSERMDAIVGQLNEKFGGLSRAVADTASGSLVQFQNAMGDLKEVGGASILEFFQPAVVSLTKFTSKLTEAWQEARTLKDVLDQGGQADDIGQLADAIAAQERELQRLYTRGTDFALLQTSRAEETLRSLKAQRAALAEEARWRAIAAKATDEQAKREAELAAQQAAADAAAEERRQSNLQLISDYYSKTTQAQKEALESDLARLRTFETQGPRTVAAIEFIEQALAAMNEESRKMVAGEDGPIPEMNEALSASVQQVNSLNKAFQEAAQARAAAEYARKIQAIKDAVNDVSTAFNAGMGAIDAWSWTFDSALENNISKMEKEVSIMQDRFDREIAFAEAAGASREELAELRQRQAAEEEAAEEKLEQKKKKLAAQQFQRQKALNLAQTAMNTASAVAEALPNIPLSVIVGALGAAQLAGIAAQPTPKFERGGSFVTNGPQMIQVGDGQSPRERVTVEPLSGPYKGSAGGDIININFSGVVDEESAIKLIRTIERVKARGAA